MSLRKKYEEPIRLGSDHQESEEPELMIQLIDISKKIFIDSLSMER